METTPAVRETRKPDLKTNQFPWWVHGVALGTFVVLTSILIIVFMVYRDVNVWEGWHASKDLMNPSYTEAIYEHSVFRTRANTWSNLVYVFIGLYAIAIAEYDRRRAWPQASGYVVQTPALTGLFGAACCFLGFGSGIFHASLTRWGQQLDVASMYAPILALIMIGIGMVCPRIPVGRRLRNVPVWPVLVGVAVVGDALLYVYKWSMSSGYVLTTLILTVIIVGAVPAIRRYRQFKAWWFIISIISLFAAVFFRQIDVAGRFTGPDAWLQGHVLWHFLTAASLGTSYLFFRSERGEQTRVFGNDAVAQPEAK